MKAKKLIAVFVFTFLIVGLALAMLPAMEAHAATIEVINTDDSGVGSLRRAIADANPAGGDTITFDLTYPATITLTSGQLDINKNLTITGPGADMLTISRNVASGPFRIFNISAGTVVTISGVTITDGRSADGGTGGSGGAAGTYGNGGDGDSGGDGGPGGGIYNAGELTLNNSTVSSNSTGSGGIGGTGGSGDTGSGSRDGGDGGTGGDGGLGGGIYNAGVLSLTDSTVSDSGPGSGGSGGTGGVGNQRNGTLLKPNTLA